MATYRLQTVLEMRERAEQAAKDAFALAMRELASAQAEQKRMEEELAKRKRERAEKVAAYLQEALAKGSAANAMQNMNRFEQRLREEELQLADEIERQKELVAQKQAEADAKRNELAEASKEKKAIEKHKEKWAKQLRHEREAREEQSQEEIGNTLHLQRQRAAARRSGQE